RVWARKPHEHKPNSEIGKVSWFFPQKSKIRFTICYVSKTNLLRDSGASKYSLLGDLRGIKIEPFTRLRGIKILRFRRLKGYQNRTFYETQGYQNPPFFETPLCAFIAGGG